MNTPLETALHIAHRGSKALLEIESLAYKSDTVLKAETNTAEAKVRMLIEINNKIMTKVMEGTSSLYSVKNNS